MTCISMSLISQALSGLVETDANCCIFATNNIADSREYQSTAWECELQIRRDKLRCGHTEIGQKVGQHDPL